VGSGVVVAAPGFGGPAQCQETRTSRLGARFSLGNFVVGAHFGDRRYGADGRLSFVGIGHARRVAMVGVGPLRIVHGE
jgi:hypothetical protein